MEKDASLSRRGFIGAAAGTAAATALGPWAGSALADGGRGRPLVPRSDIGLILYTVRDLLNQDAPGTLAAVRRIGYRKVEVAGYPGGRTAAQFRELLTAAGLRAMGTHIGHDQWRSNLQGQLDDAVALRLPWVGTAGIAGDIPRTTAGFKAVAQEFNAFGQAARRRGLRGFYFHNHDGEFRKDPATGEILLETLIANTDPRFVSFEVDIFWADLGLRNLGLPGQGQAAAEFVRKHRERIHLFHVKDHNPLAGQPGQDDMADPGEGDIDFARVFEALGRLGKRPEQVQYMVERDTQPDSLKTARTGYGYLRSLRARRNCDEDD